MAKGSSKITRVENMYNIGLYQYKTTFTRQCCLIHGIAAGNA